jgi:sugar/nucleoside kinase (ribokinase family)
MDNNAATGTNMAIRKAVICGDGCMNVILKIPATFSRGTNTDIIRTIRRPGGNALVSALALARWQVGISYIGVIGKNAEGDELIEWMRQAGIDYDAVIRQGSTRISYAILDEDERTILDERKESVELIPAHWHAYPPIALKFHEADVIMIDRYCSGIHALILQAIRERRDGGKMIIFVYRTGGRPSQGLEIENRILPSADICLTKKVYLDNLRLGNSPVEACKKLSSQFNVPIVVATLGRENAVYYNHNKDECAVVSGKRLTSLQTTLGGGDFFRAGFISAYLEGLSIKECTRRGNVVAALHCSKPETSEFSSLFFSKREIEEYE